jgi:hypothetical protein
MKIVIYIIISRGKNEIEEVFIMVDSEIVKKYK